jgi:hypothetical protein
MPNGVLPPNVLVTNSSGHNLHDTDYGNWQGRVGIAYRIRDSTSGFGVVTSTANAPRQVQVALKLPF